MTDLTMTATVTTRRAGDRSTTARLVLVALAALLLATAVLGLTTGASGASGWSALSGWLGFGDATSPSVIRDQLIILDIRLPRLVLGTMVGAGLAVSGAVLQGLFRNPLADPGLVGVSAGASLGAVGTIVLGGSILAPVVSALGAFALPAAAFVGGLATTFILYQVATSRGQTMIATMLLAGIAISALAMAVTGVLIYLATDSQLRDLTFWNLGSLAGSNWSKFGAAMIPIVAGTAVACTLGRGLNAITLGEATARHLGIPVQRLKYTAIIAISATVGASVAVSGGIGFVGIVVPHVLRLVIGPDHRFLLPASALLGASFLLMADAVSRVIVAPAELPIGIITAVVGGPFFLWILLQRRGQIGE